MPFSPDPSTQTKASGEFPDAFPYLTETQMNVTFQFASRDAARNAAHAGGWDLDDLQVAVDGNGNWGWVLVEEPNFNPTLEAPPLYRRADAEPLPAQPLVDETEADVSGTEPPAPDEDEPTSAEAEDEIEPEVPEEPAAEASISAVVPEPEPVQEFIQAQLIEQAAQPGERILQINGSMLPAAAKLRAVHFAKQLGLEITIRDASTMAVVEVVKAAATRGKGGRSNANDLIIEMCMRPEGATVTELRKAASERGASISGDVKDRIEKLAQEHGLDFKCDAVFRNNKPVIGFFLSHADEEVQDIAAD
jgi:hypothetical protein